MSTRCESLTHDNLLNPLELTPTDPRIVSRTGGPAHSMKMLDDTSLIETALQSEDMSQNDKTAQQQQFIHELCIPKIEPSDVCDQSFLIDEEALTDLNLSRPLIPFATPYKLKDPVIVLERCDKIWQTLTLIKNAQSTTYSGDSDNEESTHEEGEATEHRNSTPKLTYVQYEPVLENNIADFKLSVKTTERLYNCVSCGNFYSKKRDLQAHVYKFHAMPLPAIDFEPNSLNQPEEKMAKVRPTERSKNHRKITEGTREPKTVRETISHVECETDQEKDSDGHYVTCLLCNVSIKDVKKHLNTYHKVICPDTMVNQFCKPISPEALERIARKNNYRRKNNQLEKLQKMTIEKPDTSVSSTLDNQGATATSKKRKGSESSHAEPKRRHTLDNTHVLDGQNVPQSQSSNADHPSLHKKQQSKSAETIANQVVDNTGSKSKRNSTTKNVNDQVDSELTNSIFNDKLLNNSEEISETTCVCGRSFRNAYTLTAHKTRCMIQSDIEEREKTSNADKGSSVGLYLTIKKHNDSYEIVGRGGSENDIPQDADSPKGTVGINTTPTVKGEIIVKNLGEYSKNHTFVKLEIVDEDIMVDIEDDMTNNVDDVTVNALTPETTSESDTTGKENVHTKNSRNTFTRQRARRSRPIHIDERQLKPLTNGIKHVCPCGVGYASEESLKDHVQRDHALLFRKCGYCKMIFKSLTELNDHSCLVIKGEPFINLIKVPCSYCNMILDVNAFDEHISSKHLVSSKSLFKCYECVSYFENMHKRQRHMTRSHGRRPCNFCSKTFSSRIRPKHAAYHFGLGFPCHDCKVAYSLMSTLKDHREQMHLRRPKSLS